MRMKLLKEIFYYLKGLLVKNKNEMGMFHYLNIREYTPTEFGKIMGPIIEDMIKGTMRNKHSTDICPILNSEDINIRNKRIQIKYRGRALHLEPTRRSNGKNVKSSKSGHPRYRVDEQDYFLICTDFDGLYNTVISLSDKEYEKLKKCGEVRGKHFTEYLEFNLVKSVDLEDPKLKDYIVNAIPSKTWKKKRTIISGKDYVDKISKIKELI